MTYLKEILLWLLDYLVDYAWRHPVQTMLVVLVLMRMFGTTVQSGTRGVLFVFGRVRRVLEPGFHPLVPIVYHVRKTPVRHVTLDLPKQRVTTSDGLVYDVQVSLVYRIADPVAALVEIDHVRNGIEVVLALVVQELLRAKTRAEIVARTGLDEELAARTGAKLQSWGVAVVQAGFTSIAPTRATLRLTQLALRVTERRRLLAWYLAEGLSPQAAVALLGSERRCLSHASQRYRTARYRAALRRLRRPPPAPVKVKPGVPRPEEDEAAAGEAQEQPTRTVPQKETPPA
jgi:hypothetical protein